MCMRNSILINSLLFAYTYFIFFHYVINFLLLLFRAAKEGLEETLMERILKLYGNQIKRMLVTQYRMHHLIMQWSSDKLYDGQLVADSSVEHHLLR